MLPISRFLPQINDCLSKTNNLVLQAEPGAGKSTALPLSLLKASWLDGKKIIMLEPRRVAVKSIAFYLAKQLGEPIGHQVGYHIRNEKRVSKDTKLVVVTEGILTRMLQNDPEIDGVGLIIFDEFHERSIHADLGLMLTIEVQQTIRDDLKILVMSATIDTQMIAKYMGGAEVIECPGRTHPVDVHYAGVSKEPLSQQVVSAIGSVLGKGMDGGDILVFLPGQADILRCIEASKERFDSHLCIPLYGALTLDQQERALSLDPEGRKRIIFSTNITETSLTVEGITCVIDSGLEKKFIYDPVSGMSRLVSQYVSKASAKQRKGRAGRLQAGTCIRLWSEEKHSNLQDFHSAEILYTDLSSALLELFQWGTGDYSDIHWLSPPPKANYESAKSLLHQLELIDHSNQLTQLGKNAVNSGLSPRLSAMLFGANELLEQGIACELAALLSERDIFVQYKNVDIIERLLAIQDYKHDKKAASKNYPLKRAAVEQLLKNADNYRKTLKGTSKNSDFFLRSRKHRAENRSLREVNEDSSTELTLRSGKKCIFSGALKLNKNKTYYSLDELKSKVGLLMLRAFPERLAKRRSNSHERYLLANGRGASLHRADSLAGSNWLVIAECDDQKNEGRIFSATEISEQIIWSALSGKIVEDVEFELDRKNESFSGRSVKKYGALVLKKTAIRDIPPDKFQACIVQHIKSHGLDILNWTDNCENFLMRAEWLGKHLDDFPKLSKQTLVDNIEEWLIPFLSSISSIKELKNLKIFDLLRGMLTWEEQNLLAEEAPNEYLTPSNKVVPIQYSYQSDPTVSVQLQEMFGQIESPKLAGCSVPLKFELLSPARRPIQTTSDLGNFWKTSYFDVAKEMRGRYPKHRWPEKPLLEKPGRSIKSPKRP